MFVFDFGKLGILDVVDPLLPKFNPSLTAGLTK